MELLLLYTTLVLVVVVSLVIKILETLIFKPERLRSKLRKQGIRGPQPAILFGNILDMKKARSQVKKEKPPQGQEIIDHNCSPLLFPSFEQWTKQYGSTFMFSLGNIQYLQMNDSDLMKQITRCTSLDLGKPAHQQKLFGPLLGQGILSSNGAHWVHQRKILNPKFSFDSVKGMMKLMVESGTTLVNTWSSQIEREGGVSDIQVDDYMVGYSKEVISRACFGRNYSKGDQIFLKLRGLEENMTKRALYNGIPLLRYLPSKTNRETKKLEKEVRKLILQTVQERKDEGTQNDDVLQMILEASDVGQEHDVERFVVDNFKTIYLAGYETAAVSAAWTLMLLATNPEWQDKARAEVLEVTRGQSPIDPDMVRKMKTVNMIIHESLRLYPPSLIVTREALENLKFGDINVPKGAHVWIMIASLHQDPEIWGPDAHVFNPQRFANGVSGSCKQPHVFMPFGVGPRVCLGQNFAMAELKILMALLLANFSFSLSPNYRHSPIHKLVVKPEYGMKLLVKKL